MAHATTQRIEAKELRPADLKLDGISQRQIEEHYNTLYKGYVNKVNEIWEKLETVDRSTANQTYSSLRALKTDESFAVNGVKLHEAYFENLGGKGGKPTGRILELIERDFGSYEAWEADFKASGLAARGWVVLACDEDFGKMLRNYSQDAHNAGSIWNAIPILVLDTYEHAYFLDYGVKRAPYIDAFMRNIDWHVVNERVLKLGC
ncbi:MAG: Fe-Mn family superoxide dismutase [Chloroflexi bacterium]|nr:Fe-Mn family superoxide dismutase [Chloroflexota bacterium]